LSNRPYKQTNIIQFKANNTPQYDLCIGYNEKYIKEPVNTKFLGLKIDNHLYWKNDIDQTVPKLSGACYAIRSMSHVSNTVTLKVIYFAYFHSIMKYGIIFGGNSSSSKNVFTLQKKVIRIIAGVKPRHSSRNLFKRLEILPLPCEYIFSLMNFIVNNCFRLIPLYTVLTQAISTNYINRLPISCFQKSAFCTGIKIFNSLPSSLTSLVNRKSQFKVALKRYLNTHSFYSVDEFLMFENDA
jgi:hypothetical protein